MKTITSLLLLLLSFPVYNQTVKILDISTNLPIEKATIKVVNKIIITNENGICEINCNNCNLEITSIGYKKLITKQNKEQTYYLEKQNKIEEEVKVYNDKYYLIKKIIKNIPKNYNKSNINTIALLQLNFKENNLDNTQTFKTSNQKAILNIKYDSYSNNNTSAQSFLVQTNKTYKNNRVNEFHYDTLKRVNGHFIATSGDLIKNRTYVFDIKKIKKYDYNIKGFNNYLNHICYELEITSKNKDTGLLIVDTSTFAVYEINLKLFNIPRGSYKAKDFQNAYFKYDYFNKSLILKEYITECKYKSSQVNMYSYLKFENVALTEKIDETYKIENDMNDEKIIKLAADSNWDKYRSFFNSTNDTFTNINYNINNIKNEIKQNDEKVNFHKIRNETNNAKERFNTYYSITLENDYYKFKKPLTNDTSFIRENIKLGSGISYNLGSDYLIKGSFDFSFFKQNIFNVNYLISLLKTKPIKSGNVNQLIAPVLELGFKNNKYDKKPFYQSLYYSNGITYFQALHKFDKKMWYLELKYNRLISENKKTTFEKTILPINLTFGIKY